ncbi:MAG: hypothetical protein SFX73_16690 [Kofleriaceae bacterium]|nr:hypothetical protein [Kofleriaceae bacterium]
MRFVHFITCLSLVATACGPDGKSSDTPDARVTLDGSAIDAPATDASIDAPTTDAAEGDGIAEVRGATDGSVTLDVRNVTVTYLKPALGNTTNDPAGFTVQSQQMGPGLFVSVDPSTLSPPAVVGDVVSFQVTTKGTVGMQPRAQAITGWTRHSQGANVSALAQNISAATDVVSAIDNYDSELVTITGALAENFAGSGQAFSRSAINTAGLTGNTNLQLRVPTTLVDALDLANGCMITATNVPMGRFKPNNGNDQAQVGAFVAADLTVSGCAAPVVTDAIALSPTSVRVTFSRNVKPSSLAANGSQFTFDNNLSPSAATVNGREVTVTTNQQTGGTTYTVTVLSSLTDLQGTGVGTPNNDTFGGFITAAVVKINELNATITDGCDLIELRAISGGSLEGYKLMERNVELAALPAIMLQANDIVVLHMRSDFAACNPATAMNETTSKTQFPAATHTRNYDTAYDVWTLDTGLTATNNVFTLRDGTNTIVDAVFVADNAATPDTATDTETQAAVVGAANQWDPALAAYVNDVFYTNAVQTLNATGTSNTGTTIQRVNNTDTNSKADWTTGAGAAHTWGLLNAGQN